MNRFAYASYFVLAFASTTLADERPTKEQVAEAVSESFVAYLDMNKPPTKEEHIATLQTQVEQLTRTKASEFSKAKTRPERRAVLKKYTAEIEAVEAKIKEAQKEYKPPEIKPMLMPLKWAQLEIGSVGRAGIHYGQKVYGVQSVYGGYVRCIQIMGKTRILAEYIAQSPYTGDATYGPYVIHNVDTAKIQEGQRVRSTSSGGFDLVVTGRYSYNDNLGAMHTVFVLEVFDPSKPFE